MGSFTLDGRQPGQLTKMFLILLASTLLHLCRGHSLGTDLHTSAVCSNIAYRCTPKSNTLAKFANFHYWIKTVNQYSPSSEIEAVNRGTWNCKMCCDGRREGPLCNCDTIQRTRQGTFSTCLLHDLAVRVEAGWRPE